MSRVERRPRVPPRFPDVDATSIEAVKLMSKRKDEKHSRPRTRARTMGESTKTKTKSKTMSDKVKSKEEKEKDPEPVVPRLLRSRPNKTHNTLRKRQRINEWSDASISIADTPEYAADKIVVPGGLENSGNTCYMNSLLFGMFVFSSSFEDILSKRILGAGRRWLRNGTRESEASLERLQAHMRTMVETCRSGEDVSGSSVEKFRQLLRDSGWEGSSTGSGVAGLAMGRTRSGHSCAPNTLNGRMALQQDAAELLIFMLDIFNAPTLNLRQRIYHGGVDDTDDEKLLRVRTLELAISLPDELDSEISVSVAPSSPVPVTTAEAKALTKAKSKSDVLFEDLLHHHFNDVVSGVRRKRPEGRKWNWDEASINAMESILGRRTSEVQSIVSLPPTVPRGTKVISVQAFRSTMICRTREDASKPLTIPVVLKRYSGIFGRKIMTRVGIHEEIDFTRFVCPSDRAPITNGPGVSRDIRYTLRLRSAICHRGQSVHEGHYYVYTRRDDGVWFLVDDLAIPRVTECRIDADPHAETLASESYILFFDLRQWSPV